MVEHLTTKSRGLRVDYIPIRRLNLKLPSPFHFYSIGVNFYCTRASFIFNHHFSGGHGFVAAVSYYGIAHHPMYNDYSGEGDKSQPLNI